jgi:hypothetical protein
MTIWQALLLFALVFGLVWAILAGHYNAKALKDFRELHEEDMAKLYPKVNTLEIHALRFQDPEAISSDMERVADMIETRQAGRQAMPRPGSLPHARVFRGKSRGPQQGWGPK